MPLPPHPQTRGIRRLIARRGLAEVLAEIGSRFGSLEILPIHGDVTAPAIGFDSRHQGGRAPTQIIPP